MLVVCIIDEPYTWDKFYDGGGGGAAPIAAAGGPGGAHRGASVARSDSATWEYMSSLPGSPHSDHEPSMLPMQEVDWNDMDKILRHLQATEGKSPANAGGSDAVIFKEYLKVHLSSLYPGQPDMCWDHPA